jgi:hypothetical protein
MEKHDSWSWGVFFYSIAFPMSIVNNFIFFVPFRGFGTTTIEKDMYINLATRNLYEFKWPAWNLRQKTIWWSNIIPMLCFLVDFCFNQIKYPFHFIIYSTIY